MNDRDHLREALERLPAEIDPRRDLWPGIAERLDARDPAAGSVGHRREGRPIAALRRVRAVRMGGAALAAAAAVAALLLYAGRGEPPAAGLRPGAELAALDHDYALVRDDVLRVLAARCDGAIASGCGELRAGLEAIDHSVAELRRALAGTTDGAAGDPWLAARLRRTLNQTHGLAGQANRLL